MLQKILKAATKIGDGMFQFSRSECFNILPGYQLEVSAGDLYFPYGFDAVILQWLEKLKGYKVRVISHNNGIIDGYYSYMTFPWTCFTQEEQMDNPDALRFLKSYQEVERLRYAIPLPKSEDFEECDEGAYLIVTFHTSMFDTDEGDIVRIDWHPGDIVIPAGKLFVRAKELHNDVIHCTDYYHYPHNLKVEINPSNSGMPTVVLNTEF